MEPGEESSMEEFTVLLVNKVKKRKKRVLVVDKMARTVSRRDVLHAGNEHLQEESKCEEACDAEDLPELRKTFLVSSIKQLTLLDGKLKLKLYLEDSSPHEVIFHTLEERQRFAELVRHLREESLMDAKLLSCPTHLRVFVTTWNVSSKAPPHVYHGKAQHDPEKNGEGSVSYDVFCSWIPPQEYDVYVVGLQECKSWNFPDWRKVFVKHLNTQGDHHKKQAFTVLASVSMWGIHCFCVVTSRLERYFSNIEIDHVARGFKGNFGNKGAVGLCFDFGETTSATKASFAFVCSHFAAKCDRLASRVEDYSEICRSLFMKKRGQQLQLTHAFDAVFWFGDLNFRLNLGEPGSKEEFDKVIRLLGNKEFPSELLKYDQLLNEKRESNVFALFHEGDISFKPTYRMEYGKEGCYNNKKNQSPSWTDRILWKTNPSESAQVLLQHYSSSSKIIWSDHRPVCAGFGIHMPFVRACMNCDDCGMTSSVYSFSAVEYYTPPTRSQDDDVIAAEPIGQQISEYVKGHKLDDSQAGSPKGPKDTATVECHKDFARYVVYGKAPACGKVFFKVHAKFIEETVSSSATGDKEMTTRSTEKNATITPDSYLKYEWSSQEIPPAKPLVNTGALVYNRALVISLHSDTSPPQPIGFATVPLTDIEDTTTMRFTSLVLLSGQPAGMIRGTITKAEGEEDLMIRSRRNALRQSEDTSKTLSSGNKWATSEEGKVGVQATEDARFGRLKRFFSHPLPVYSYERLLRRETAPLENVDTTKLEEYLSPTEFQLLFHMDLSSFKKLRKWKQILLKKQVDLF